MKFGSQFQWFLQAELNEEYGSHCLRYKQLKKQLSRCRKWDPSVPLPEDSLSPWDSYRPVRAHCVFCDVDFWAEVGKEVKDINSFFRKRAVYLLQEHGVSTEGQERARRFSCFFAGCKRRQAIHVADSDSELAREARQLVEFAQVNTIALRKLMKKYDKVHRTGAGREFTERLMRKEHGNSFLKERSLLHELTALHSSLGEEKIAEIEMDETQRERCAEILQAAFLPPGDTGNEARLPGPYALDLKCSVCLDVFMEPVALKCGHVFCKTCACRAARIHPLNPKGLKMAVKSARCPICRQADVFQKAVPLPEVGELVKNRFPEEWRDRQLQDQQILPYKSNTRLDGYIQPSQLDMYIQPATVPVQASRTV